MSRKYTTRQGDTLKSVAIRFDGSTQNLANIKKANSQVVDPNRIPPGMLLSIPVIPGVAPVPPAAPLVGGDKDEIAIEINGELLTQWENVDLVLSMDEIGSTFQLSKPWNPTDEEQKSLYKPFQYQDLVVSIGGQKQITGTLIKSSFVGGASAKRLSLTGYSIPGVLADVTSSPENYPLEWVDKNIEFIAKALVEEFGITVKITGEKGPKFKKVKMEPTQRISQFLMKLAKQRGLLLASDSEGSLLFQNAGTGESHASLIDGNFPIDGSRNRSVTYDGQKRYKTITALGDGWSEKDMVSGKGVIEDPTISVSRSLVVSMPDIIVGQLKSSAASYLGRLIASSIQYQVPIVGWRDREGRLWQPNTTVTYKADDMMVYKETELLIRKVQLSKRVGALTASLTLVYPEAYNGEIRTTWPWN